MTIDFQLSTDKGNGENATPTKLRIIADVGRDYLSAEIDRIGSFTESHNPYAAVVGIVDEEAAVDRRHTFVTINPIFLHLKNIALKKVIQESNYSGYRYLEKTSNDLRVPQPPTGQVTKSMQH